MKRRAIFDRIGKLSQPLGRGFFLFLPFFLLLQLVGQPDLDDQHPAVGARLLNSKIFKQDQPIKNGLSHGWQPGLAVGSRLFTPGFYLSFVRVSRPLDFVRTSIVSRPPSRSPPPNAAV